MAVGEFGFISVGMTYIAFGVGFANICLLLGLLYVYWRSYRQLKSKFTIGLLYFASFLLLQNIFTTLFLARILVLGIGPHGLDIDRPIFSLLSINIIQLIALSILFRITWE